MSLFAEPWFPLGDWRWAIVAFVCLLPGLVGYRREIWAALSPKKEVAELKRSLKKSTEATIKPAGPGRPVRIGETWIATGNVYDVTESYVGYYVALQTETNVKVSLWFSLDWKENIDRVCVGEIMRAEGKVKSITEDRISLDDCQPLMDEIR